jgi:hypothetical protein
MFGNFSFLAEQNQMVLMIFSHKPKGAGSEGKGPPGCVDVAKMDLLQRDGFFEPRISRKARKGSAGEVWR